MSALAYAKWKDVKDRRNKAFRRAVEFAKGHFGCEPQAASACAILSPDVSCQWQEIAELVRVARHGDYVGNVGDLVEFLGRL